MWLWMYFADMVNIYNQLTLSKGENTWWRERALSNQLRVLTKTEGFPEKKFCFETIVSIPTWVFSLLACPMDLTCQLWQLCEAILKIKPYIYPPNTYTHTHIHTFVLFLWRRLTDTVGGSFRAPSKNNRTSSSPFKQEGFYYRTRCSSWKHWKDQRIRL